MQKNMTILFYLQRKKIHRKEDNKITIINFIYNNNNNNKFYL